MYIPKFDEKIVLIEDWTFTLQSKLQNANFCKAYSNHKVTSGWSWEPEDGNQWRFFAPQEDGTKKNLGFTFDVTIKKGEVLEFKKFTDKFVFIYSEHSKAAFYATYEDVRNIQFDRIEES